MGFLTPSYDKPGKGIDKDAPQKRSFFRFFDIFFRKFWKLVSVNLLYILTSLPTLILVFLLSGIISGNILMAENVKALMQNIADQTAQAFGGDAIQIYDQLLVSIDLIIRIGTSLLFMVFWGMGPVTAGATYIFRNFAKETHAWIWSDFVKALKDNFKQSLGVFLIDLLAFVVLYTAFVVYGQMSGMMGALRYVIVIIVFVYTLMHPYLYQLMITFEMKFKDLYRNALLFAIGKLPSNLFVTVVLLLLHLGSIYFAIFYGGSYTLIALFAIVLLECLILVSFSGLLINFNVYPKLKPLISEDTSSLKSLSEEE